jgi:type VI secretion system secreted protein Hcp
MPDYHLNIAGIQGEDKDAGFVNQVKVSSWNINVTNPTTVGASSGSAAHQCVMGNCNLTLVFDKAIQNFFANVTKGTHAATATLSGVKSGATQNKAYYILSFTEVFITSLSWGGASGMGDVPDISLSFSYDKLTTEYLVQQADGTQASTGQKFWQQSTKTAG